MQCSIFSQTSKLVRGVNKHAELAISGRLHSICRLRGQNGRFVLRLFTNFSKLAQRTCIRSRFTGINVPLNKRGSTLFVGRSFDSLHCKSKSNKREQRVRKKGQRTIPCVIVSALTEAIIDSIRGFDVSYVSNRFQLIVWYLEIIGANR